MYRSIYITTFALNFLFFALLCAMCMCNCVVYGIGLQSHTYYSMGFEFVNRTITCLSYTCCHAVMVCDVQFEFYECSFDTIIERMDKNQIELIAKKWCEITMKFSHFAYKTDFDHFIIHHTLLMIFHPFFFILSQLHYYFAFAFIFPYTLVELYAAQCTYNVYIRRL